jgi:Na+-driven multidrug efflux pump
MIDYSRPLWQRFLTFLLPMMLANILQSLSGTINSVFIGQMIGTHALASISTFFPLMIFLISFVIGLGGRRTSPRSSRSPARH